MPVVGLGGLEPPASSLSGMFAGCVHAGGARDGQLIRLVVLTVTVRWVPGLSVRCGTRVARDDEHGVNAAGVVTVGSLGTS
jgi:hypothetical protein